MSNEILTILLIAAVVGADKPPVLIWSSDVPLGNLPQSHLGQIVKSDQFSTDYLKPLTSKHNLVVFLQDKLTLEDFINHADVYNINGDGGAFKNVKASLDDQYSVQLPAVSDPSKAIETLTESFKGKIAIVDNPEDIASLPLESEKQNLIIVKLPNILGGEEAAAFKRNDDMIGKCMHHLKKRDVKFSAIYTAEESANVVEQESHAQRRLLAEADANSTGKFYTTPQTMMYMKSISLTVVKMSGDPNKPNQQIVMPFTSAEVTVSGQNMTNQTMMEQVTLTLSSPDADATILMDIMTTYHGEYQSFNGNVTVKSKGNGSDYDVDKMPMDFKIQATKGFSYHCSKLRATPVLKGYNNTNNNKVYITVEGFQFEAFTNSTSGRFSDNVWDCVEFFTTGIWMGILTTLVLIMVLFFGVTMIANITTMDRFDDPKGKTITVTVNE